MKRLALVLVIPIIAVVLAIADSFSGGGGGGSGSGPSITQGTFAALPGTCTTNDLYVFTNSIYNFSRCSATNTWSYFINGFLVTPPGATSWTNVNVSTVTFTTTNGFTNAITTGAGSGTGYQYATVAGNFTKTFMFKAPAPETSGSNRVTSVVVSDGTKCMQGNYYQQSTGASNNLVGLSTFTDTACSVGGANPAGADYSVTVNSGTVYCISAANDGVNVSFKVSFDCVNFNLIYSSPVSFFGGSVTRVGWGVGAAAAHQVDLISYQ